MLLLAFLGFLVVNAWTILLFREDKLRAIEGAWRVPEARLLGLAIIGGSPGALLARRWFRHKTRKEPFSTCLLLIAVMQVGAGIGWIAVG